MKKPINEIAKLKRLAGLITESEYQESLMNEASLKSLIKPLVTKLESIGYEVEYDSSFGFTNISGFKTLPNKSILRVSISPSDEELQQKNYGGTADQFSTVDVSFTHWTPEVTKKLFGLYKSKELVGRHLPDESGTNIDLGTGMFDIPVDQSVEKIIAMVKKAEDKTSGGQTESTELNEGNEAMYYVHDEEGMEEPIGPFTMDQAKQELAKQGAGWKMIDAATAKQIWSYLEDDMNEAKEKVEEISGEAFEMMDARVNRNHILSLLAAAEGIMGDLEADGFDAKDIHAYINQIIVNDI